MGLSSSILNDLDPPALQFGKEGFGIKTGFGSDDALRRHIATGQDLGSNRGGDARHTGRGAASPNLHRRVRRVINDLPAPSRFLAVYFDIEIKSPLPFFIDAVGAEEMRPQELAWPNAYPFNGSRVIAEEIETSENLQSL